MKLCSIQPIKVEEIKPNGNICKCNKDAVYDKLCKEHYCEYIEKKLLNTINKFGMFKKDKILVAFSGGKDSTVLLYIMNKLGFNVEAITLNAYIGCYSKENVEIAKQFCEEQNITLHHISFRDEFGYSLCYLRTLLHKKGVNLKSCTICGVLRRYLLNKKAREMKATKIAFGHNMDDEVQSILMNFMKGNLETAARIGPVTGISKEKQFVQRVKPLYLISEQEVILYSKIKQFPVKYEKCPCSTDSYRYFLRSIINNYESQNPNAKKNTIHIFLKILPYLKEKFKSSKHPNMCKRCGEPTSSDLCRTCSILSNVINYGSSISKKQ